MINRRKLITGLISLAAAPAIVRASSLMPVKVMRTLTNHEIFLAMFQARMGKSMDLIIEDLTCGRSIVKIDDENNSNGVIFTPIRDYLKLDQSLPTESMERDKEINPSIFEMRKVK